MNIGALSVISRKSLPSLARRVSRQKLIMRKQSPHIFFVAGVAGTITSTVLACRATLKLPDTLTEIELDLDTVKQLRSEKDLKDLSPNYTRGDLTRDTALAYSKAVYKLGRLYGPSISIGVVSIAALSGSHIALSRRNTALMAAYTSLSEAYANYRERVIKELGPEKELDIYHARVDDQDEDTCIVDPNKWSPYARFFDEASPHWVKNPEFNRLYVQCQQNYANEKLRAQGHLFLNEVYDMLGFERTQAGAVVGWVIGDEGDNYVDFGIYEATNARFINGLERTPLLDFNVDGVIFDKI